MPHSLIIGMTMSGKTTLAKLICERLHKSGETCLVLDPMHDDGWLCDYQTDNADEFLEQVKLNRSCFLFVDESGQSIGRYNSEMEWLATASRHLGHSTFFLMQAASQVSPIIRSNCATAYIFACDSRIMEACSIDFNEPVLRKMTKLEQFNFYRVTRFEEILKGRVDLPAKDVIMERLGCDGYNDGDIENENQNDDSGADADGSDGVPDGARRGPDDDDSQRKNR